MLDGSKIDIIYTLHFIQISIGDSFILAITKISVQSFLTNNDNIV